MSKSRVEFDQINLVVADMDRAIDFYRRLGVTVSDLPWDNLGGWRHATADVAEGFDFDFDNAPFAQVWNVGWKDRADLAGRVVIGFKVESRAAVDEIYAEMTAAGAKGLQPPYDAFWGARYAILEDPDGAAVGLMSPRDPQRQSPPGS